MCCNYYDDYADPTNQDVLLVSGKNCGLHGLSADVIKWCKKQNPHVNVKECERNAMLLIRCFKHFANRPQDMARPGCTFRLVRIPLGILWEVAYNPATQSEYVQQLLGRWE